MKALLIALIFNLSFAAQTDQPSLRDLIQKTCSVNPDLCLPSSSQKTLPNNLFVQCESLKNQYGCTEMEKKNSKVSDLVFSCDPQKMCKTKNIATECALGSGQALADLLIGLVTFPWKAGQFIEKAFENDKACFENKNNIKENLIEMFDLSIPEVHARYRIPPEIKSSMKNWPCAEIRNYLYQKNKSYQAYLGPLVAKGLYKPENTPSALNLIIEDLKKEIGVRWQCYTDSAKAELACYSIALLFPSLALKIPAQTVARITDYDLTKVWQKLKAKYTAEQEAIKANPQIALWDLKERGSYRQATQLEHEIKDTLENGRIVSANPVGEGVMKAQIVTFENGMKGIWKKDSLQSKKDLDSREIAAYKVDEKLGSNLVPYTTSRVINGQNGSIQLMIQNADDAVFGKNPKFFSYFDYLLANRDRHGRNILTVQGRPIAIDHGFTFKNELVSFPSQMDDIVKRHNQARTISEKEILHLEAKTLLPPKSQYDHLVNTNETTWRQTLQPYLHEQEIRTFLIRRREIIDSIEKAKKEMSNDIFPDGAYSPMIRFDTKTNDLPPGQYSTPPDMRD
ncbi:MAG: hypothetical protein BroJett040_01450 [Oligoflexia bacterium]|nr:MAG: hypothetical protein BroJett040_01450 [Oligoflexia bacterium]